jgi:hypothetical protein
MAVGAGQESGDGSLPSGRDIGREYGRHERWGRMVKRSGLAGELDPQTWPSLIHASSEVPGGIAGLTTRLPASRRTERLPSTGDSQEYYVETAGLLRAARLIRLPWAAGRCLVLGWISAR